MTKFAAVLSGMILYLLAFDADARQERITGYVQSLDDQAHKITMSDGAVFPLKPDADTSWVVPGTKVDLICDYDAIGVVGCGIGLAALSDDLNQGNQGTGNQGTTDQPPTGAGTGFSNELGYQTPDANLPDRPTESIFNVFRRRDR